MGLTAGRPTVPTRGLRGKNRELMCKLGSSLKIEASLLPGTPAIVAAIGSRERRLSSAATPSRPWLGREFITALSEAVGYKTGLCECLREEDRLVVVDRVREVIVQRDRHARGWVRRLAPPNWRSPRRAGRRMVPAARFDECRSDDAGRISSPPKAHACGVFVSLTSPWGGERLARRLAEEA
jgi:hypothetical protein